MHGVKVYMHVYMFIRMCWSGCTSTYIHTYCTCIHKYHNMRSKI